MWSPTVLTILVLWPLAPAAGASIQPKELERVKRLSSPNYSAEVNSRLAKYVVSFRSRRPMKYFGDNHYCGGSIISPLFVLTAASCVMDERKILYSNRVLQIVAGAPDRLRVIKGKTLTIPVKKIFVPVNYTLQNTFNIALVKLGYSLPPKNAYIGILDLPSSPPTPGALYKVLGWGRMYAGGVLSAKILYIDVMVHTQETCGSKIENYLPEMLCAINMNVSYDQHPCPGDTGSPLMGNTTIYGVVIYGLGCGHKHIPSVYTDVWYHLNWIIAVTKRNGCCALINLWQENQLLILLLNVITVLC